MKIETVSGFESKILRGSLDKYIDGLTESVIQDAYFTKEILKKSGEQRILSCIDREHLLYSFQKQLKDNFLDYIPLSSAAFGYVKKRSYVDFIKLHEGKNFFIKMDIKDFFNSIKSNKLSKILEYYVKDISLRNDSKLLEFIVKAVTLSGALPQGAVTSPVLSNIFFRALDIRISRYCRKLNITYSRYVDDLLFSSDNLFIHKKVFVNGISKILISSGFKLNYSKLKKSRKEISLNGFVVGESVRLSRNKTAFLSSIIYCYQKAAKKDLFHLTKEINNHFYKSTNRKVDYIWLHHYLAGYRSFLLGLLPFDSAGALPDNISRENSKLLFKINRIEDILTITANALL